MISSQKYYAAPLEGITGFPWRKAHKEIFGGTDKYFTPFLVANQTHKFKTKELRDITQDEESLIPQILTDKPEHFIWAAKELSSLGYTEINLNLGCPSPTVVTRGKGSGLLKDADNLDIFLDKIFSSLMDFDISIKTRIGFENKEEWPKILEIFNRYPIHELIIHTRLRSEFYEGNADFEIFKYSLDNSNLNLVYNGDVISPDHDAFRLGYSVMAGRGLVKDPSLFRQSNGGCPAKASELKDFHDLLLNSYKAYMTGDGPVLHHMKSMWEYYKGLFDYDEKTMKTLKKARHMNEYLAASNEILKSVK